MKHYGDITKINGAEVPTVDIVTGGSPCQDLSVAGKRAGLAGERSGLFMEQVRIIKEMREHDKRQRAAAGADDDIRLVRPRYMVWENVPGAFSSNGGEDFRAVLEETARVAESGVVIPEPEGGRWTNAGCIMGNGWSIAWRVHDAQFWGVPQRRRRIALVADFGGDTAPEILFERESVSGDTEQSEQARKDVAEGVGAGIGETISFQERAGKSGGVKESLYSESIQEHCQPSTINTSCLNSWDVQSKHIQPQDGIAESLYAGECRYGGGESYVMQEPVLLESNQNHATVQTNGISTALPASMGMGGGYIPMVCDDQNQHVRGDTTIVLEGNGSRKSHRGDGYKESDTMYTLNSTEQHAVCCTAETYSEYVENEKASTVRASSGATGIIGGAALVIEKSGG